MIYLIKPLKYQTKLIKIIKKYLKEKYPNKKLIIKKSYSHPKINDINTYIIVDDSELTAWNGLEISKKIRFNEPNSLLILAATEIDYIKFFRSHVGFFGIIDLKNLSKYDIQKNIKDSVKFIEENF